MEKEIVIPVILIVVGLYQIFWNLITETKNILSSFLLKFIPFVFNLTSILIGVGMIFKII